MRLRNLVVGLVSRVPARVQTKLLVAFLAMVALIILLGAVGLQVLSGMNARTEELIELQRKIAAYRQVQHDTTRQLYGVATALLSGDQRELDGILRQLSQFGYDLDRLQHVAEGEVDLLATVREDYDRFIAIVTGAVERARAGQVQEAREVQLSEARPLADRLERLTNQLVNVAEADMLEQIEASQRAYDASRLVVVAFALGSIILALALGYVFSWSIVAPLTEIAARLRRIAGGEFAERIDVANRDELGALASDVNRTSAELGSLYQQLEERAQELRAALERQTASSEVLGVISRSTSELQPVLDAIVATAARLCQAEWALVFKLEADGRCHLAAASDADETFLRYVAQNPVAPGRATIVGRTALVKGTVHVPDVLEDPEFTWFESQAKGHQRTVLGVPLLRGDAVIGVITMSRNTVQQFTDKEIELVTTFADQAVIAIENVRLFDEVQARTGQLQRSVSELEALGEISRAISSTLDLRAVLDSILAHACQLADSGGGAIYVYDPVRQQFDLEAGYRMGEDLIAAVRGQPMRLGDTLVGQCAERREAVQIDDLTKAPPHLLYDLHSRAGVRALLAVPLVHQQELIGALVVRRKRVGAFAEDTVGLLQLFAAQSAVAIQNARLFREIEEKSRELEAASRHKSEFLANMSHELRTPLNAVLGYAELIQDGIYGDVPQKMQEVLERIQQNGRHLLGLINDVLDLAKIEAGQLTLSPVDYSMRELVLDVVSATEALAAEKKLALEVDAPADLPPGRGDERRLTQVLLNLVSNAIKFTEAGSVTIRASAADDSFRVAVTDTGVGIAAGDRERIFEEFQQVDSSSTRKKGGTGLGLAIARRIVELHGGRIWVESTPGQGSTFAFTLPLSVAKQEAAA
jgi:signal transduction histidine kinase/CHASE3 domain sensor protein